MSIHHYNPCKTLALGCALAAIEGCGARDTGAERSRGRPVPGHAGRPPAPIAWIGGRLAGLVATTQRALNRHQSA